MSAKRHGSIFRKIFILFSIIAFINIFLFLAIIFENQMELISENTILRSRLTARDIRSSLESMETNDLQKSGERLHKEYRFHSLQLVNRNFETLFTYPARMTNTLSAEDRQAVTRTLYKQEFEDKSFHQRIMVKDRTALLFIPVVDKSELRVAIARIPLSGFGDQYALLLRQALVGAGFILLTYTILFLFTLRLIVIPLKRLSTATKEIAGGNLKIHIAMQRNDELGDLANDFNEMGMALQRQHNKAINANPLSGLPGNIEIVDTVCDLMKDHKKFAVLYCDLDNFKAYNDTYGFLRGDDVILYTRDVLREAVRQLDLKDCFVGHEGGDDFVVITDVASYEPLAETIIRLFDSEVKQFYTKQDQKRGYIEAYNREGQYRRFRFVSVSIGIVTNHETEFESYPEVISIAAEMKKHAKATNGSSYSVNRRKQ